MPLGVYSGQSFKTTTNIINFQLSEELFSFISKYLVLRRRFLDQQNFTKNASKWMALPLILGINNNGKIGELSTKLRVQRMEEYLNIKTAPLGEWRDIMATLAEEARG